MKTEPRIAYWWGVATKVAPLFTESGGEFYDFQDAASIGCSDAEFFNSMHPTDVCTTRMFLELAKRSPTIEPLVSRERLEKILRDRVADWDLGL